MTACSVQTVREYYDSKTESILRRYGPGPRVHYHNGILEEAETGTPAELKRLLARSQENLLDIAADFWHAKDAFRETLLDVGCGLGGGSIYWAERVGATVTSVTNVERHAELIAGFVDAAGVRGRVTPLVCNAAELTGENLHDAAVAIDSMCHMPRDAVFAALRRVVKPAGALGICDFFYEDPEYGAAFDAHWTSRMGTIAEYVELAEKHGFEHLGTQDLTERAGHFWTLTLDLMEQEPPAGSEEARRRSRRAHELVREGYETGGLRYALLRLRNRP